jgi:tRNA (cytidine/uridine-2'-O-)-methyltransferase
MVLHIVLLEPEIPQNTGNIARTCVVTGAVLHIIGPAGFSMEDKYLKRAGLDYWNLLDLRYYTNYEEFKNRNSRALIYFATTKAKKIYSEIVYDQECMIMFGKETAGIPEKILKENLDYAIRIPMLRIEKARSLNLSNSVAVVAYEVLRQWNYPGLK